MANKLVFAADSAQFTDPVKRSAAEVRALSAALRKMDQDSRAAFKQAELSAKATGASEQDLQKMRQGFAREQLANAATRKQIEAENVVGSKEAVTAEEAKRRAADQTTAAYARQRAEVDRQLPMQNQQQHALPTTRLQMSTILRGGGIRGAEAFAAMLPGAATIAAPLFLGFGAASLAKEAVEGVESIRDSLRAASEMAATLKDGFEAINAPIETSTDSLRKQNAELQLSIDKLEHNTNNGAELAAANLALEMDHVAERARNAYDEVKKTLQADRIGFFKGGLTGQGSTSEIDTLGEGGFRDISRLSNDLKRTTRVSGADSPEAKNAAAALAARQARLRSDIAAFQGKINGSVDVNQVDMESGGATTTRRRYDDVNGNQNANRETAQGLLDILDSNAEDDAARKKNGSLEGKQKQLELQKANSEAALTAQKKAAEEQRKQWDGDLAALQASGKKSAEEIVQFWLDRENATKAGSENYLYADKKANESLKQANDDHRKLIDEGLKMQREFGAIGLAEVNGGYMAQSGNAYARGIGDAARTGNDLQYQREDAARSVALANVQWQEQAGLISKADAEVQRQTLHTMQYEATLQRLRSQYAAVPAGPEADAQRNRISGSMVDLDAKRDVEAMQDAAAVAGQSWFGALQNANAKFVQDTQDTAKQISGLYSGLLGGINGDLTTFFANAGRKHYYNAGRQLRNAVGGTARDFGGKLAETGLQRAEGSLLGLFGESGKPDGTKARPLYVMLAGAGIPGAMFNLGGGVDHSSIFRGIANMGSPTLPSDEAIRALGGGGGKGSFSLPGFGKSLFGGSSSSFSSAFDGMDDSPVMPSADAISAIGDDGSSLSDFAASLFGGARATGGGVQAGKVYMTGENGPELFSPSSSGYIHPADRTSSMMGSGGVTQHIDARGSSDPAQVRVQARRGATEGYADASQRQASAMTERRARKPLSAR